jgi:hypothetical protein
MPARTSRVTGGGLRHRRRPLPELAWDRFGRQCQSRGAEVVLAERTINSSLPQSTATPSRQRPLRLNQRSLRGASQINGSRPKDLAKNTKGLSGSISLRYFDLFSESNLVFPKQLYRGHADRAGHRQAEAAQAYCHALRESLRELRGCCGICLRIYLG